MANKYKSGDSKLSGTVRSKRVRGYIRKTSSGKTVYVKSHASRYHSRNKSVKRKKPFTMDLDMSELEISSSSPFITIEEKDFTSWVRFPDSEKGVKVTSLLKKRLGSTRYKTLDEIVNRSHSGVSSKRLYDLLFGNK